MGLRRVLFWGLCAGLFTLSMPRHAQATSLKISEVMTGAYADPNVQYVLLRFSAAGGSTDGYTLYQYDNSNPPAGMGSTTLVGTASHTQEGATLLLATSAAEQFFQVTADAHLTGGPLAAQGTLCLVAKNEALTRYDDCVVYGNAAFPEQHGNPASVAPFNPSGGIQMGMVTQRVSSTSSFSNNTTAQDFWTGVRPWPQNNAGMLGTSPPSICGNGDIEGLEECDHGSANGTGNACTIDCLIAPSANCPSDQLDPGEQCDDRNTVNHDGCSATCRWEPWHGSDAAALAAGVGSGVCGNHLLESGEACDPPGANCDSTCQLRATVQQPLCGDGSVEAPANPNFSLAYDPHAQEQCDPGDADAPAALACGNDCRWLPTHAVSDCNNRIVEAGEQCDDGNLQDGDGCSHLCQFETQLAQTHDSQILPAWSCGDGILSPGEMCDHGARNGTLGDVCGADCSLDDPRRAQASLAGGTNTAGTVTGATNTGGTVTGGTNTGGTTTAGTNTGGTVTGATTTAGTNTGGTVTGATTTAGTNTGGTVTGGTDTAGTNTGGTVTGATTAGTNTGGTTTMGTTTAATNTGGTVTGGTNTGGTVTGGTNTGGTVTGGTNTGGTVTGGTNTGGTVAGSTNTTATTGGSHSSSTSSSSSSSTGTATTGTATGNATTGTTTTGGGGDTSSTSIDGTTNPPQNSDPNDAKPASCRNLDTEGAAWLMLVLGLLSASKRSRARSC